MLDADDLKNLADHLMATAEQLEREQQKKVGLVQTILNINSDEQIDDDVHVLRKLARQIEVIGYNPLIFEDIIKDYNIQAGPLDCPLDDTPLHINDEGYTSQVIVRWRLSRGV